MAVVLVALGGSRASAAVAEFPLTTPNSAPTSIVPGPDGNLWVAESDTSRIARVTPGGAVTEFTLPAGREPIDLAVASALLFFTERAGNRIGRLDPGAGSDAAIQASLVEFGVPTAASAPTSIVAGPDGNLWFTENAGDRIGRVTTAGAFVEFAVPGAGSGPWSSRQFSRMRGGRFRMLGSFRSKPRSCAVVEIRR